MEKEETLGKMKMEEMVKMGGESCEVGDAGGESCRGGDAGGEGTNRVKRTILRFQAPG